MARLGDAAGSVRCLVPTPPVGESAETAAAADATPSPSLAASRVAVWSRAASTASSEVWLGGEAVLAAVAAPTAAARVRPAIVRLLSLGRGSEVLLTALLLLSWFVWSAGDDDLSEVVVTSLHWVDRVMP